MDAGAENTLTGPGIRELLNTIAEHLSVIRDKQEQNPIREWLTVHEVAEELRVSRDTIERLIGTGKLPATTVDTGNGRGIRRLYRVRRDWLNEFLTGNIIDHALKHGSTRKRRQTRPPIDFIGD